MLKSLAVALSGIRRVPREIGICRDGLAAEQTGRIMRLVAPRVRGSLEAFNWRPQRIDAERRLGLPAPSFRTTRFAYRTTDTPATFVR